MGALEVFDDLISLSMRKLFFLRLLVSMNLRVPDFVMGLLVGGLWVWGGSTLRLEEYLLFVFRSSIECLVDFITLYRLSNKIMAELEERKKMKIEKKRDL